MVDLLGGCDIKHRFAAGDTVLGAGYSALITGMISSPAPIRKPRLIQMPAYNIVNPILIHIGNAVS